MHECVGNPEINADEIAYGRASPIPYPQQS